MDFYKVKKVGCGLALVLILVTVPACKKNKEKTEQEPVKSEEIVKPETESSGAIPTREGKDTAPEWQEYVDRYREVYCTLQRLKKENPSDTATLKDLKEELGVLVQKLDEFRDRITDPEEQAEFARAQMEAVNCEERGT